MSVSFGFKKKIETKVVNAEKVKEEGPDYLTSVDGKVLQSTKKKEEKKELVIPLIKKNVYRLPVKNTKNDENALPVDDLEAKAAKELIEESKNFMENTEQNGDEFENLAIPLLLKNKVPDGFETDERLDVSLRPDEASEAQYDQVPVAAFGLAVLRGMGWTPEEGIGKTFKQNTKMLEQKIRPKGLGLGAETPSAQMLSSNKSKSDTFAGDNVESLALEKGANVLIISGALRDKYGIIIGIDIDTARCVIKMAIGGKTERVGLHCLRVVSKKEYEKNAKDLSRFSKAYTGESINIIGNGKGEKRSENHRDSAERKKESSRKRRDDRSPEVKEKRRKEISCPERSRSSPKQKKHKKHKTERRSPSPKKRSSQSSWVRPQMRVRIIDKSYKKGRYFRDKVTVEDILGQGVCCCKTDDGKILDDLKDSMLETVIPKSSSEAYVIVVRSKKDKYNGKLAKILEKNKEMCEAMVQLIEDRDTVLKIGFEDMCEFAGDPEMNAMF